MYLLARRAARWTEKGVAGAVGCTGRESEVALALDESLSIKKGDASLGSAVVLPLLPRARVGRQPRTLGLFQSDRAKAGPRLVPLLELGRMVEMDEYSGRYAGGDDQVYKLGQVHDSVGGRARRTLALQRSWFT